MYPKIEISRLNILKDNEIELRSKKTRKKRRRKMIEQFPLLLIFFYFFSYKNVYHWRKSKNWKLV